MLKLFSLPVLRAILLRYGLAVIAAALAFVAAEGLGTYVPESFYPLFVAAVAFASWYGGLGPGLLATILATLASAYHFLLPEHSLGVGDPEDVLRLVLFALVSTLVSALNGRLREAHRIAGELAQAREELLLRERAAERRYGELVQGLDAVVWEADAVTLRFTFLSEQAEKLLGHRVADWLADPAYWTQRIHPEDRERVLQTCAETTAEGASREIEYRFTAGDGREVWLRDRIYAVADEQGRARQLRGRMVDVTDRKQAEETLRKSEEWYRRIVDTAYEGIWLVNAEARTAYVNERMAEMLGYGAEEMLRRSAFSFVFLEDEAGAQRYFTRLKAGKIDQRDCRLRRKDGAEIWVHASSAPVMNPSGEFIGALAMMTDITERRRAEGAIRFLAEAGEVLVSSLDYQTTLEHVARLTVPHLGDWCVIDVVEDDGTLRTVAVAHVDLAKEEITREIRRRYPPVPGRKDGVWEVLNTGRPVLVSDVTEQGIEEALDAEHRRLIEELGIRSFIRVPLQARGQTRGVISFGSGPGHRYDEDDVRLAEDLARRAAVAIDNARLYQELQRADSAKAQFLAMLAHELRNPLGAISNALQVLYFVTDNEAARMRAMGVVERQVRHQARLVDDLLDVSRITRGKIELRREDLDLLALLRDTAEDYASTLEEAGIRLALRLPEGDTPVWVSGDRVRLAQIVGNLLHNSVKFTDRGGRIDLAVEVTASPAPGAAVIRLRDTGIGIEAEMLPHVFETFAQADRSLDRSRGGLGLGLALVKGLVELHGGSVSAHSAGLGQGTEFIVTLPLCAAPVRPLPAMPVLPPAPTRRLRVMVIEDNRDAAETLQDLLEFHGHQVAVAHSGTDGLRAAPAFDPDVILCDIGLPGMSGYEVARRIRGGTAARRAVLIAVTGYGQEEDRRHSAEAGFDHHLVKPVDPEALTRLLAGIPTAARERGSKAAVGG